MGAYLRRFDGDDAQIYNVKRKTDALEDNLRAIPTKDLKTVQRKVEIMDVFQARKKGTRRAGGDRINASLIQDFHIAAFLLDPSQSPEDDTLYEIRFHDLIGGYLAGSGSEEEQIATTQKIFVQYKNIRMKWESERHMSEMTGFLKTAAKYPMFWWNCLRAEDVYEEVCKFAKRILSATPSSCSVERIFRLQTRIQTEARNSMATEK